MEVGFLGLGIMGKAMAANLLRHGFRVTVWNRTLSKVRDAPRFGRSIRLWFGRSIDRFICHTPSFCFYPIISRTCGDFCWQCDELVAMGAAVGDTPASVVAKCKYTIAMLSDPSAALSVKRRREPFCSYSSVADAVVADIPISWPVEFI